MTEIDGLRPAEPIRQLSLHAHTPIVAVTAHIISNECLRLLDSGIIDCLAKPIDESMLLQLLSRHGMHVIPSRGSECARGLAASAGNQDVSLDW